jgi:hypothetical protein
MLVNTIKSKVFKFLFNYEGFKTYTAVDDSGTESKDFYHIIEYVFRYFRDNVSIYLTWMPADRLDVSIFFAGVI